MKKASIIFLLLFLLVFILSMPLFFLCGLILWITTGFFDKKRVILEKYASIWFTVLTRAMPTWDIKIEGKEHFQENKTYMMVVNHQSMLDIFILYTLNFPFKIIAKSRMFKIPFIGWAMSLTDHIGYTPNSVKSMRKMMESFESHIEKGNNILVYAEGERSLTGKILPFKEGAFIMAKMKKLPIIPLVIKGTKNALPDNVFKGYGSHSIRLKVLDEIPYEKFADMKPKDAATMVRDIIVQEYNALAV